MIIRVEGPYYWSTGDEDAFFHWLKSIKAVRSSRGVGTSLELTFARRKISAHDLRELYGLCRRYGVDVEPLEQLNSPRSKRTESLLSSYHRNVWPSATPGKPED
jgi:hypothetical protein